MAQRVQFFVNRLWLELEIMQRQRINNSNSPVLIDSTCLPCHAHVAGGDPGAAGVIPADQPFQAAWGR